MFASSSLDARRRLCRQACIDGSGQGHGKGYSVTTRNKKRGTALFWFQVSVHNAIRVQEVKSLEEYPHEVSSNGLVIVLALYDTLKQLAAVDHFRDKGVVL